ncbi:MAG: MFS transporter [Chloroflexota bacterium]
MAAVERASEVGEQQERPLPRLGALGYPNYRMFWIANVCRVFGLQFRFIGAGWLTHLLDPSPVWLGVVGVAAAIPTIVLSIPAGVIADRFDNRKVMVVSQALTAVSMFAMAALVWAGLATVWWVMVWSVLTGALMALANPAQNAILPRLIEMRAIASAVAYTSAIWNVMRIVGPAGAGLLIAVVGPKWAFGVTGIAFALSTLLLMSIQLAPLQRRAKQASGGMLDGFRYIMGEPMFFATIGLSFFTSLFGTSYIVLLPEFSTILNAGAQGFGYMEAAAGVGSLLGTIAIVRLGRDRALGPTMLAGAAAFGVLIAAFTASNTLLVALVFLFLGGIASSIYLNIGMTALQIEVPDDLRGRVMGIWSMTYFLSAVGGLPAGVAAVWLGTPLAVGLSALSVTAFAIALWLAVPSLRRLGGRQREVVAET